MKYSSDNGSQVVIQDSQSLSVSDSGALHFDAKDDTLVLVPSNGGFIDWSGVQRIYSGTVRVDCSQAGNVFKVVSGRDGTGLFIGNEEGGINDNNDGCLEIFKPSQVTLNGAYFNVFNNGIFSVCESDSGMIVEDEVHLRNNAVVNVDTAGFVSPERTSETDRQDAFILNDNARLNVKSSDTFDVSVSVFDETKAFIFTKNFYLGKRSLVTIGGGSAEFFVGGNGSQRTEISWTGSIGDGGFNFVTSGGENKGILILNASVMGTPLDDARYVGSLIQWDMLWIDDEIQKNADKFNVDCNSVPGMMIISLRS
jgi:hypothetical protein